jgi:subtilase family serine protease
MSLRKVLPITARVGVRIPQHYAAVALLLALILVPASGLAQTNPNASSKAVQFVPAARMAPDIPAPPGFFGQACLTPPPVIGNPFFNCYTPAQMASAYNVDQLHAEGTTGKGQTIVIVDSFGSPTALQDLQFFSQTFGLPEPDLTIIHPTGTPTFSNSMRGIQLNWAVETSLDLQWAHAMAPDAKLVLIAANPAETEGVQGFPNMFIGEQLAVNKFPGSVISQSFTATEQSFDAAALEQVARFDQVYRQAVANHITVVTGAGDTGTSNPDKQGHFFPFPTVGWPASDLLVTAVGGTWLQLDWTWTPLLSLPDFLTCLRTSPNPVGCILEDLFFTDTPGRTEAVWNEPILGVATGGGRSALFPTPAFQSGISQSLLQGRRGLPDVSWNAAVDGGVLVFMSFPGIRPGWQIIGGTSAGTPQIAALVAMANQLRQQAGKGPVGYLKPRLYQLPSGDLSDNVPLTFGPGAITLDSNALTLVTPIPGSATTAGWDLTTGIGSPRAFSFVHDLADQP